MIVLKFKVEVLFSYLLVLYSHEPARLCEGDLRNGRGQARQGGGDGGVDEEGTFYLTDWTAKDVFIHQSVPVTKRTWQKGLGLDNVGDLQGEYCAVQVKCLGMSAFFCSHLRGVHYVYSVTYGQLTGMDCLDRETGQLRLTVGREEDTTEQLGLHKM